MPFYYYAHTLAEKSKSARAVPRPRKSTAVRMCIVVGVGDRACTVHFNTSLLFLLFSRFLPPNPDQAVYSKVLVSFRRTFSLLQPSAYSARITHKVVKIQSSVMTYHLVQYGHLIEKRPQSGHLNYRRREIYQLPYYLGTYV